MERLFSVEVQKRGDSFEDFGVFGVFVVVGFELLLPFPSKLKIKEVLGLFLRLIFMLSNWNPYLFFRPVFRSYKPVDEGLQEFVQPDADVKEITDKVSEELEHQNEGVVMETLVLN